MNGRSKLPVSRIDPKLCIKCKGYKLLCGLPRCPILEAFHARVDAVSGVRGGEVEGATPPAIIVGEKGYPKVPILYAIPPGKHGEEAREHGDVKLWASKHIPLTKIVKLRSSMVYSVIYANVSDPFKLYEKELSLAAVSLKPVESEALVSKIPTPTLRFDSLLEPVGPTAPARIVRVVENPRIPRRLEKLVWDDARASEAVIELYKDTGDVYVAISALSLGLLGRLRNRRLVPTRWAITAVDSIIGSHLLGNVKTSKPLNNVYVAQASYLGNKFTVILMPGPYEAEMIEIWRPRSIWTQSSKETLVNHVYENIAGRVNEMDGGFMAARLAVLEHLASIRRSARVLIIREIGPEYYAPVGNWHIRETVRRALKNLRKVESVNEAIAIALNLHGELVKTYVKSSKTVRKHATEKRLDEYLSR